MDNQASFLEVAIDAVKKAFQSLDPAEDRLVKAERPRDVTIAADTKLHKTISSSLLKQTSFPILSEEDNASLATERYDGYHWIVDPLDGSLNYSRQIPWSCISVALWKGEEPVLGVIYDLFHRELFWGLVGAGAKLDGKDVSPGNVQQRDKAILCTGFPVATDFSHDAMKKFVNNAQSYKKVRLLGSAALSLAYVASGRADVYEEHDIALWDVAAGIALVKASGGAVRCARSQLPHRFHVWAGNHFLATPSP